MARYTEKAAQADIAIINDRLNAINHAFTLKLNARNGWYGLDQYRVENGKCVRNIFMGSPKDCYAAARDYACDVMSKIRTPTA